MVTCERDPVERRKTLEAVLAAFVRRRLREALKEIKADARRICTLAGFPPTTSLNLNVPDFAITVEITETILTKGHENA